MPPRHPRELEDAGPALRIEDSRHPGGPALDAEIGRRPVVIAPEEPVSPAEEQRRALGARADLAILALFISVLFLLAGGIFYLNGTERGDLVLAAAGLALVVIGAAVLLAGLALRRAG
jgi:hypothetical protein